MEGEFLMFILKNVKYKHILDIKDLEIEDSKINKGYKLRFETAVEDQKYHTIDIEIPLTTEGIAAKTEGKNYIRYVRLNKI